jgi:hypothetical protein
VTTDHPSVVIAPGASAKAPTVPPLRRSERTEKTVVIRDRKTLDRLRLEASRRRPRRRRSSTRAIYLVGIAVLASLAAGTLLATLGDSSGADEAVSPSLSTVAAEPTGAPAPTPAVPEVVDLEDLPVVRKKKNSSDE